MSSPRPTSAPRPRRDRRGRAWRWRASSRRNSPPRASRSGKPPAPGRRSRPGAQDEVRRPMSEPSNRIHYFDNNATTPVDPEVAEVLAAFLRSHYGNPSSLYPLGRLAKERITEAREEVAAALGASRSEVVFT
ncbi:MAG: aminotransferase class V-fold PLP-dependent enzyme, partial [Candidatus Aminicenantes bacterium]|nr:aminotransferase class V-fold PLP-dependent enzyme [Candidatus Aminicenantes bacterium]